MKARFPKQLPIALSEKQRAWLDQQAEARGLSVAAIVREIVQAAMTAEQTAEKREGAA